MQYSGETIRQSIRPLVSCHLYNELCSAHICISHLSLFCVYNTLGKYYPDFMKWSTERLKVWSDVRMSLINTGTQDKTPFLIFHLYHPTITADEIVVGVTF